MLMMEKKMFNPDSEVWKDIPGYEGLYKVSNLGRVKSLPKFGWTDKTKRNGGIMSQYFYKGYYNVKLCINQKYRQFQVHRLVALAFIPNPKDLPFINHKDENSINNAADNLEWCTHEYNINYGTRNAKVAKKLSIPVAQYTVSGTLIETFSSLHEASKETGINISHICNVCKCLRNKAGGFIWKYVQNH